MLYTQIEVCDKRPFCNAAPRYGRKKVMTIRQVSIRQAVIDDSHVVASLVLELLIEIEPAYAETLTLKGLSGVAESLLADDQGYWAFLAVDDEGGIVGVLTLNECAAIYANGLFGEIAELYVTPEWRSAKTGALLVDAAVAFGRDRGWSLMVVGAPELPDGRRAVNFYLGYGFKMSGPGLEMDL